MSAGTEQRKLAAIMFTDMVGYSALAQRNEALALQLLEEHRGLLRSLFPRFNGREVKTIGDAFLVEFHSALEAAQCAIEIQRTLAKRNHDVAAARRIEVRIGIHIGDVVQRADGDVLGDGVNIASRIEPLAGANGICISVDVERQIRNTIEASLVKLGATELKNIQVPMELFRIVLPWEKEDTSAQTRRPPGAYGKRTGLVAVCAIGMLVLIGTGWFIFHKAVSPSSSQPGTNALPSRPGPITSLAVLPLLNLSRDPDQEYFVDGFTDLLCTELAGVSALKKVTSRTTIMQYKGTTKKTPEIARELGVDAVVEGSVQREANLIVVSIQLIEGATDRYLWATNYTREVSSLLKLQTELARGIAAEVKAKLTPEEEARLAGARIVNPAALEALLRGRHHEDHFQFDLARESYERAIALDPTYAEPRSALANWYVGAAFSGRELPRLMLAKGKEAATKSLELDDSLAEAHAGVGWFRMMLDWDWRGADQELKRALALNPGSVRAHGLYGFVLIALSRFDEAAAQMRRGQELDPLSWGSNVWLPSPAYNAGHYDESIDLARGILAKSTNFYPVCGVLGRAYLQKRMFKEALAQFEVMQAHPGLGWDIQTQANLALTYALSGNRAEALKLLDQLKDKTHHTYLPAYEIAIVYTGLGEKEQALAWLAQAEEDRSGPIYLVKVEPIFSSLRSEPRFHELLKKMNFPP